MFDAMLDAMNAKAVASLMRGQIPVQAQAAAQQPSGNVSVSPTMPSPQPVQPPLQSQRDDYRKYTAHKEEYPGQDEQRRAARGPQRMQRTDPIKVGPKVGRNDPCPCGSGKKYKNCHGKGIA